MEKPDTTNIWTKMHIMHINLHNNKVPEFGTLTKYDLFSQGRTACFYSGINYSGILYFEP